MTRKERLEKLKHARNPNLAAEEALEYISEHIGTSEMEEEEEEPVASPSRREANFTISLEKGVDFFTEEDIQEVAEAVRYMVNDGEKGDQGEQGPQGTPGERGLPGKDGRDGETPNIDKALKDALSKIPKTKEVDVKAIVAQALDAFKESYKEDGLKLTAMEKRLIRLGGGGASFLTQLQDVMLNAPTNGQALIYDSTLQKWKNGTVSGGGGGTWGSITGTLSAQTDLQSALNAKEPTITGTTSADFWSGAKTFINFAATVRATVLTGLSLVSTTVIAATDTVLVALGSLQAQITALTTTVSGKASTTTTISTTAPLSGGGDLSANRTLTTSMATNKLIGRGTAGTGVMEEITLGTNLSFTGTTLNAAGGGVVAPVIARIRRSTNQSIATGASFVDLSFDTSAFQVNGTFWTTGATVTIPEAGYFQINAEATFEGAAAAVTCDMQVLVNGTLVIGADQIMAAASATAPLQVMALRLFASGDTIKVQVKHSSITALNILTEGDHSPDIVLQKASGAKGDTGAAGGLSRLISSIAVNTTGGAAANTDYVYKATAGLVFTFPNAVGNTNKYTLKATTTGVSFATTSSQTVDGSTTGTLITNQSLTAYSDNSNWLIS